jgi:hypothetical protein
MNGHRTLLLVLSALLLASPAPAGIIFGKKKPKPEPAQRVPELIEIVKTSSDESKRADAADELRKYDPLMFPEMIPTLLDVLQNDAKPSVRLSAMSTLTKYRPVSPEIGQAIEQTLAKDASMRVRLQARSTLLQYHWAGYRTPKEEKKPTTKEPPLAQPLPGNQVQPLPGNQVQPLSPPISTAPPPLNKQPGGVQRMPVGPARPSSAPYKVKSDGPELGSPF